MAATEQAAVLGALFQMAGVAAAQRLAAEILLAAPTELALGRAADAFGEFPHENVQAKAQSTVGMYLMEAS